MGKLEDEIKRRRTFAIISHPDAGKTTLTEKFLLYGGAIAQAGAVKGKKNSRHAVSDWMEIEKQRGISVTSSVMQFQYKNYCINILDTLYKVILAEWIQNHEWNDSHNNGCILKCIRRNSIICRKVTIHNHTTQLHLEVK